MCGQSKGVHYSLQYFLYIAFYGTGICVRQLVGLLFLRQVLSHVMAPNAEDRVTAFSVGVLPVSTSIAGAHSGCLEIVDVWKSLQVFYSRQGFRI